jgi:hypothetical protein
MPRPIDLKLAELRERREREERDRVLLAAEILFLRDQIGRVAKVMELVQAGKPFGLIPPGPYWRPGNR